MYVRVSGDINDQTDHSMYIAHSIAGCLMPVRNVLHLHTLCVCVFCLNVCFHSDSRHAQSLFSTGTTHSSVFGCSGMKLIATSSSCREIEVLSAYQGPSVHPHFSTTDSPLTVQNPTISLRPPTLSTPNFVQDLYIYNAEKKYSCYEDDECTEKRHQQFGAHFQPR